MSRPYAEVIGDPIAQSKSPAIHNFWLGKLGIDAEYRACHVRPDELTNYFARRREDANWRGCNITLPHKETALVLADRAHETATRVGATNCIVPEDGGLVAYNFDSAGIGHAIPTVHSSVCIIGAGGAARAAIPELDVFCAIDVRFVVRDRGKGLKLAKEFDLEPKVYDFDDPSPAFEGVEGVINASPLGMIGQPPMPKPILDALSLAAIDAYVFDMVYNPLETELLKRARAEGYETIDGLVMLVGQAKMAFRHFFGALPPDSADQELRKLLGA